MKKVIGVVLYILALIISLIGVIYAWFNPVPQSYDEMTVEERIRTERGIW